MAQAQNLSFFSRGFEEGVKLHLGLDSTAVVTQQQTDTITSINLSGFDIKDTVFICIYEGSPAV